MEYALGVLIFAVLLVLLLRMIKLSSADRYARMTGKDFEVEAKRVSPIGGVMLAIQRLIDPAHRVEHVQQAKAHAENEKSPGAEPDPSQQ